VTRTPIIRSSSSRSRIASRARTGCIFDLRPREGTRDDEVERVRAWGATEVADHRGQYGPGTGWVVLADPEGNEFCILRSEAEARAGPQAASTDE
jgi:hypothetical protein